jgi:glycogen(starch) synthase
MRASVVICTLDRAASLAETLEALRLQRGVAFEVIVVNGPSTDETDKLVLTHRSGPRLLRCPQANVSMSRNIGIAASGGEIVAFLDDDCVPDPSWLEALVAGYDDDVAGTGGRVFDAGGARFEFEYPRCDRVGATTGSGSAPSEQELGPGADPLPYLTGGNMSFRRDALVELGGFDEELEYCYDDVEVCLRLVDAGATLRHVPDAFVRHKRLASRVRNSDGVLVDPFTVLKNRCAFALRNGVETRPLEDVLATLHQYAEDLRAEAVASHQRGQLSDSELELFVKRIGPAVAAGTAAGLAGTRRSARFIEADRLAFVPYGRAAGRPIRAFWANLADRRSGSQPASAQ